MKAKIPRATWDPVKTGFGPSYTAGSISYGVILNSTLQDILLWISHYIR